MCKNLSIEHMGSLEGCSSRCRILLRLASSQLQSAASTLTDICHVLNLQKKQSNSIVKSEFECVTT